MYQIFNTLNPKKVFILSLAKFFITKIQYEADKKVVAV